MVTCIFNVYYCALLNLQMFMFMICCDLTDMLFGPGGASTFQSSSSCRAIVLLADH